MKSMRQHAGQLISVIRHSGAFQQSAIASGGNIITGLVAALATILASRILGPENFGVFSVATALIAIFSKIGDMGLNAVVTRYVPRWQKDKPHQAKTLLAELVNWKLWLTGSGALILLLTVPVLERVFNYPHRDLLYWSIAGAAVLVLYEYVYVVLSALHEFVWLGGLAAIQAVIKLIGFLLLWMVGWGSAASVVALYALAPLISSAWIMKQFSRWLLIPPHPVIEYRNIIRQYANHAAVGVFAMTLIANVDILMVQKYLTSFDTGVYAGAGRIALFVSLLTVGASSVFNNRVARYQDRPTQLIYLRKSLLVVALAVVGFLMFLPLAGLSISLTIGSEYLSGLPALIILVGNAFLGLALIPYISFFYAVEYPQYFSIGGILQVAVIMVLNLVFLPQFGLMAAAWSRLAATALFGLYTLFSLRSVLRYNR